MGPKYLVSSHPLSSNFSSNRKLRQKQKRDQYQQKIQSMNESNLPLFSDLIKKIYLKSHPDLIRSHSADRAAVNDASMQSLNGVLSTIKTTEEFPPATDKMIPFFINIDGEFRKVDLKLKTGGGDCRYQLARCFEDFFEKTNVNSGKFSWGKDYFRDVDNSRDIKMKP